MICIYHKNCVDGFASALAVRKKYPDVKLFPRLYHESPPDVHREDVIITDFSFSRNIILEMAEEAKTITIIDHHKSAIEDLKDLPQNVTFIYDINHSGCVLTYKYLFRKIPPLLFLYIEDHDLHKHHYINTKAVCAGLFSHVYDFDLWEKFLENTESLCQDGEVILRKQDKDINEILLDGVIYRNVGGLVVPCINVPYNLSTEACSRLVDKNLFVAAYYYNKDGIKFSLRSNKGGYDVSKIAKKYNGGGHENAAGFMISSLAELDNIPA